LTLLLVVKSMGEYQYTFQGKTPARKYPFLCSSSSSLAKLSKGEKKKSNQIPLVEEKLEPCFAKGSLVTLFKEVTMLQNILKVFTMNECFISFFKISSIFLKSSFFNFSCIESDG
jgi:hypothetical protein